MPLPNLASVSELVEKLKSFRTLEDVYVSQFYVQAAGSIREILDTPHFLHFPGATPRIRDFLRIVQWNIERGNYFEGVLDGLNRHAVMKHADLILLNEVDVGMVRTGNRHVAAELANSLGMNFVFGTEYIELGKGIGEELNLPGQNESGLHGNAILSRYPLSNLRIIPLPCCFEPFHFHEKRFGRRIALVSDLRVRGRVITAVTSHLEVRNTPECRSRQLGAALDALAGWKGRYPVVLGGDFNSNTFARGTLPRTLRGAARMLATPREKLLESLCHPGRKYEPLFRLLRRNDFSVDEFNDDQPTARVRVKGIEDLSFIPEFVKRMTVELIPVYHTQLPMRLDWLAGRGLAALRNNEVMDHDTGVASHAPCALPGLELNSRRMSDHDPIVVDVRLAE